MASHLEKMNLAFNWADSVISYYVYSVFGSICLALSLALYLIPLSFFSFVLGTLFNVVILGNNNRNVFQRISYVQNYVHCMSFVSSF